MTLKNDIAKKRLLSVVGIIGTAALISISAMGQEAKTVTNNKSEILTVMAGPNINDDLDINFNNEDLLGDSEPSSNVLEEKIAIYPEYDFEAVETTAYFIEDSVLKAQPYDDAEDANSVNKYQEITLVGTNE